MLQIDLITLKQRNLSNNNNNNNNYSLGAKPEQSGCFLFSTFLKGSILNSCNCVCGFSRAYCVCESFFQVTWFHSTSPKVWTVD